MSTDPRNLEGIAILQRIAAEALDDESFRRALLRDPKSELEKAGLSLPEHIEVEILENTPTKLHIVLPSRLEDDEELDRDKARVHHLMNWWPV